MATSSKIHLEAGQQPAFQFKDISADSADAATKLLQENHDRFHMFFNMSGFHNHIVHHLLTLLALHATPAQIKTGYDNNASYQRPPKQVKPSIVEEMHDPSKFKSHLGKQESYNAFLAYFQDEISKKGWEDVIQEYFLVGDERADDLLVRLYSGFLHPLIHLGFGVEFKQPAIIAEALAQAAAHGNWMTPLFVESEKAAKSNPESGSKTIVELLEEMRSDEKLRNAPRKNDSNKIRDGILERAPEEMIKYASLYSVREDELEEKTAEMINACAYFAAAAQRPPHKVKFDFFYMHAINASIFLPVLLSLPTLSPHQKARLLEHKVRTDLTLYVSRGCPKLHLSEITNYASKHDSSWPELFERVAQHEDDGHASKFIRALANGERVCKKWEGKKGFLVKGDMWRVIANMVLDSVEGEGESSDWIRDVGFEETWRDVPVREGRL